MGKCLKEEGQARCQACPIGVVMNGIVLQMVPRIAGFHQHTKTDLTIVQRLPHQKSLICQISVTQATQWTKFTAESSSKGSKIGGDILKMLNLERTRVRFWDMKKNFTSC